MSKKARRLRRQNASLSNRLVEADRALSAAAKAVEDAEWREKQLAKELAKWKPRVGVEYSYAEHAIALTIRINDRTLHLAHSPSQIIDATAEMAADQLRVFVAKRGLRS